MPAAAGLTLTRAWRERGFGNVNHEAMPVLSIRSQLEVQLLYASLQRVTV